MDLLGGYSSSEDEDAGEVQYDSQTMDAPVVVGKGVDKVAMRIRELAEKNDIPLVRNPPLARLLYDEAEMDEQIPLQYYKAVAEIIQKKNDREEIHISEIPYQVNKARLIESIADRNHPYFHDDILYLIHVTPK